MPARALLPREPEAAGLAALLELHQARAAARFDSCGRIVLFDHQDRRLWDKAAIERAGLRLRAAVSQGSARAIPAAGRHR